MNAKKRFFLLEDDPIYLQRIKDGIAMSKHKNSIEIIEFNKEQINNLINDINNHKALSSIPPNINLFVIDACLIDGEADEYGLKLLKELKRSNYPNTKYVVITQWDPSEFNTDVAFERFVNKNIYAGFELKYRFKDLINKLWSEL